MNISVRQLVNRRLILNKITNLKCLAARSSFQKYHGCTLSYGTILAFGTRHVPNLQIIRHKYYKKDKSRSVEKALDSDEDDDDDDETPDKKAKIVNAYVTSLRTDLLVKCGLSLSRNKVEKLFYESRIRLNGKKILKKSTHINIGDEIDVIHGPSPSNPKFLIVGRVQVLSAKGEEERLVVKLKRFKSLLIENYKEPWQESVDEV